MDPTHRQFALVFLTAALFLTTVYLYHDILSSAMATSRPHLGPDRQTPRMKPKYAYTTFLSPPTFKGTTEHQNDTNYDAFALKDPYFVSVRVLNYQILHAQETRTRLGIPFVVLTMPRVPQVQLDVLRKEGATIVTVEPLDIPDLFDKSFIESSRFKDVLAKLRLWQLTDYTKVLFLDADTFLLRNLDGIFDDPRYSTVMTTLPRPNGTDGLPVTEGDESNRPVMRPPEKYIMAASTDTWGPQIEWEIPGNKPQIFCACFMLFAPSEQMFQYYKYILTGPEAPPNAAYPEQDLLWKVHAPESRMPWIRIPIEWSANDGRVVHQFEGVRSLHVKGWKEAKNNDELGNAADPPTKKMWQGYVSEMEWFWRKNGHRRRRVK
jgi:alpha-N-acetylglucosamine transferase